MEENELEKKIIDDAFGIGVMLKLLIGIGEAVAGTALVFFGQFIVNNIVIKPAKGEIAEDPHDFVANTIIKIIGEFSASSNIFAAVYLLFHGAVNIFLAVSLLRGKLWAYPAAIAGFGLFISYQLFRYFHTHSILLLAMTLFDIIIVALVWLEFKKAK